MYFHPHFEHFNMEVTMIKAMTNWETFKYCTGIYSIHELINCWPLYRLVGSLVVPGSISSKGKFLSKFFQSIKTETGCLLTLMEGQDWAWSACRYPGEWQLKVLGRAGIGKAVQEAGPLMLETEPEFPSVRGGLIGWEQVHSSSSSEECGGWGEVCSVAGAGWDS